MPDSYQFRIAAFERDQPLIDDTCFAFRKDRPLPWLQRIAIWVLKRLGCYRVSYSSAVRTTTIESDKLVRLLMQARNHILRSGRDLGSHPKAVIGWKTFKQFSYGDEMLELSYNMSIPFHQVPNIYGRHEQCQIRGFHIVVFPWFEEGVLIIPDETESH